MKHLLFLILAVFMMPVYAVDSQPEIDISFTKEIDAVIRDVSAIKPGQTRKELSKFFTTEGGLFQRTGQYYVYRKCPYIKVEVRFEKVGHMDDNLSGYPEDKIVSISKPFLEFSIAD
jgi:hypothetical protein